MKIKYDVIDDDNTSRPEEIIDKSIMVDLNGPFNELSKIELLVTDGNGRSDYFSRMVSDVPDDPLARKAD